MNKDKIKYLILALVMTSCSPFYVPTQTNIPIFTRSGEIQLSGIISANKFGRGISAGIAPLPHIGIIYNFNSMNGNIEKFPDRLHRINEIGAGWFKKDSVGVVYEMFIGYGSGKIRSWNNDLPFIIGDITEVYTLESDFRRFFVQTDIGLATKRFEGALSLRLVQMKYENLNKRISYYYDEHFLYSDKEEIGNEVSYFVEPSATIRFGVSNLKLQTQIGISIPLQTKKTRHYEIYPLFVNVGLHFQIGKLFEK